MKHACGGWFGNASFTFTHSLPLLPLPKPKHPSGAFPPRAGFCHPPTPIFFIFLNILRRLDPSWSHQVLCQGSSQEHSVISQALMNSKHHPHTESMGGAGSIGPKAKFFHNKQFLGLFLLFTDSQTAAFPSTAPVLLHTLRF